MFERDSIGDKAVIVFVSQRELNDSLSEFQELVTSSGAQILDVIESKRAAPHPKYFLSQGKVEALNNMVANTHADVVIINRDLSPSQERNLEKEICCRVLSHSGLILDIFAQRARTFEGKLQVELAQLQHIQTRLVRGWTHLERQKGGIGLRGPGETQLETDRRLIRERIKTITSKLDKVRSQREENRRARKKSQLPVVALVGYTNAGKSTLFNVLTAAKSLAEDKLFATLDPLMRKIALPNNEHVILADTVGFIQNLPHQLVEAFKGTLEETKGADLLLHVVDISSDNYRQNMSVVSDVLEEIHASEVPVLKVFNKIDLVEQLKSGRQSDIQSVWVSALDNHGIDDLLDAISEHFFGAVAEYQLVLTPRQGRLRALLYQKEAVLEEQVDSKGDVHLKVSLSEKDHQLIQLLMLETT